MNQEDTAAIREIAADVKHLRADVARIERHLEKQNGRIDRNTIAVTENTRKIAIQENRCALMSKFEEKDLDNIRKIAEGNRARWIEFFKENGLQLAELIAVIGLILQLGKVLNWW